ncbi:MAG: rRNA maturation RNase YbeY [Treponema sp.]|jgi:probable rRNA maturation factor|nr:rRNA maturation RNase YbeY [Treponema sp.]
MNRVAINAEEVPPPPWTEGLRRFALRVLDALGKENWDLSVLLCGDGRMRALNARYRGKDESTDVLSFGMGETAAEGGELRYLSGDIVISLPALEENARYFETGEDEELRRLLIHGILHLDGMDHATNDGAEPMLRLQEKILTDLAGERILPEVP